MTKKFRIWDKSAHCFINNENASNRGCGIFSILLSGDVVENYCGSIIKKDPSNFIIQQWTGLTDLQGVEIYEGDICSVEEKSGVKTINGRIEWGTYTDSEYVEHLECWMFEGKRESLWEDEPSSVKAPLSCICNSTGVKYCRGLETEKNSVLVVGNIFESHD